MGMCAQEACLSFALKWYFHAANSSVFPICLLLPVWGNYLLPRFNLPWLNFCSQPFFVTFLCDIKFRLGVLHTAKRRLDMSLDIEKNLDYLLDIVIEIERIMHWNLFEIVLEANSEILKNDRNLRLYFSSELTQVHFITFNLIFWTSMWYVVWLFWCVCMHNFFIHPNLFDQFISE